MAGGNVGSCTVSLHDFRAEVMDSLLVWTSVAGSSLEKLSTGRLVGGVMQSNRQTRKIRSLGSYSVLIGACVCHLAFASKRLGVHGIWAKCGLRDDSFRSAKGGATSTAMQRVGGHTRGQPCTAEATTACICPFALCCLGCERVNCDGWQCWELHCVSARFLSSSYGRSVGLDISCQVVFLEVVSRPFGGRCYAE